MSNLDLRLSGIVTPLVTPLSDRDTIDEAGTRRLIEHVIEGGVSGIFILGSTGEAPSLSYRLRRDFIRLVCEIVQQRVPVLVGISDTAFIESVELAHIAATAGANVLVLTTPYYFPAGQTELIQYVNRIVEQLPLPLMLYNMPSLTKVWFDIDSLKQLAQHDRIMGFKDSSGDLDYFRQLVGLKKIRPDWTMLIGPEHLLAESIGLGGDGGVHSGSNCYPELFTNLYHAVVRNDQAAIDTCMDRVKKLRDIYNIGKYASRYIKATKCALSLLDICSDHMAEPFTHFLPPERRQVQKILQGL